jgi:hypothetical protein
MRVNSVYGSPAHCGSIPQSFNDAATRAIQLFSVSCAAQRAAAAPPLWLATGLLPVPIPPIPNPAFGTPRTVLNPRQFQLSARFSF